MLGEVDVLLCSVHPGGSGGGTEGTNGTDMSRRAMTKDRHEMGVQKRGMDYVTGAGERP